MQNVLIAANISEKFKHFLLEKNVNLVYDYSNPIQQSLADGIVTSTKLIIDKKFIDSAKKLKWVARLGSGLEIIDTEYARQRNVQCFNSPNGIANAVAEHALSFIINLQKNIFKSANEVKNYQWIREANRGVELENKTVALIGFGATGQAFAKKLKAFGADVIFYDKYKKIDVQFAKQVSLQDIYDKAEIVSYHVPLNAETENYYNADNFLKPHILINTSRGKVVYSKNIIYGFVSKKIIAAGLDVLDFEEDYPFNEEHKKMIDELLKYNCIITPHIAGYSFEAVEKMCDELIVRLRHEIF